MRMWGVLGSCGLSERTSAASWRLLGTLPLEQIHSVRCKPGGARGSERKQTHPRG